MKKKFLAVGLAGMLLLGMLAGCGGTASSADAGTAGDAQQTAANGTDAGAAKSDGKLKIAMCMPLRDQFLTSIEMAAQARAKELGYELVGFDANKDVSTQISQISTCASDKYDVILTAVTDTNTTQELIQAAGDVPIVFFCRGAEYDKLVKGKSAYVGCDQNDAGQMQGEFLAKYFQGKNMTDPNIVILMGNLGEEATNQRTDTCKKTLKDAGLNVNYVYEDTAEWDRAKAMDKFTQFMGSGKPYDAVVCNNDDMALGVIEAFTSQGKTTIPVPIVGVDATDGGCQAILDGTLAFTTSQNGKALGTKSVDVGAALAKGEEVDGMENGTILWIPFEPVTKDNVADYYTP